MQTYKEGRVSIRRHKQLAVPFLMSISYMENLYLLYLLHPPVDGSFRYRVACGVADTPAFVLCVSIERSFVVSVGLSSDCAREPKICFPT